MLTSTMNFKGKKGKKWRSVDAILPADYDAPNNFEGTTSLVNEFHCTPDMAPRDDFRTPEALMNEDVLHLIFQHFGLQPGSQTVAQTRHDLLSAAKTCKTFAEPALNTLWSVLPSLLPLLLLFPSAEVVNGQYFVDNLPVNKWERFEIHARRVRTIYMETPRATISPMVYLRVRSMYDGPLLPGLKSLHIPDNNPIDFPSVMLLALSSSFETVELNHSAISERNFFIPFLNSLAEKSPQLGHLSLRGSNSVSLEPVYRFSNLWRLEIRLPGIYFYPLILRRLGNMVNLVDLTLDVGTSTPVPSTTGIGTPRLPTSSPSSYRSSGRLRKLHIIGIPSSITRVLDDINLTNLTDLVIDEMIINTGDLNESFWRRCFDQISICHAINHITINQSTQRQWNYESYSLSTSWLFSIFNLRNITSLVINRSALSGSDDDFRQLAGAFPKLRKLVVPSRYHSHGRTLASLIYFAQECPELREIKICIAFNIQKNLDAIQELPFIPKQRHDRHLEKLYINSQFGHILQPIHMVKVAEFLDRFFPNLSILETYESSDATETANWTGIQQIRLALQSAGNNALRRAKSEMDKESMDSNDL